MAIRAVIFDLGGVFFSAPPPELFEGWDQRLLWHGPDVEAANRGEITAEEYALRCAARCGSEPQRVLELIETAFCGCPLDGDLVDYARALRPRVRIAALTNHWSFARALLARRGIAELFDLVVSSAEEGVCKPDPRIYRTTLARLDVAPHESAFVDDVQENVDAACALGMHAVRHLSTPQTIAELDALLESPPRPSTR